MPTLYFTVFYTLLMNGFERIYMKKTTTIHSWTLKLFLRIAHAIIWKRLLCFVKRKKWETERQLTSQ